MIDYYQAGEGQALLFFHGFGISPNFYSPLLRQLTEQYLVIAPYLYQIKNLEKVCGLIKKDLHQMKVGQELIIVSHSLGAASAIKFILDGQFKANKLIIFSGLILPYKRKVSETALNIIKDTLSNFLDISAWRDFFLSGWELGSKYLFYRKQFLAQARYALNVNLSDQLDQIVLPTLIVWGKNDQVITVENGYQLQKKIKNSRIAVIEGNHLWFLHDPQKAKLLIDQFVNED